jgi:hypothetical protein
MWYANRVDVQTIGFETVNGVPRVRVNELVLAPDTQLYPLHTYRPVGPQFDCEAVNDNGLRWQHTVALPLLARDAANIATLRAMMNGELVFVGQHRDGRFYIAGLSDEGFTMNRLTDPKGRLGTDANVLEITFSLTDAYGQLELLLQGDIADPADLPARAALTQVWVAVASGQARPPSGSDGGAPVPPPPPDAPPGE